MAGREHLHHDDTPSALAILADLLDHRSRLPAGYEPTGTGAWVDWDALGCSWLSSSEVAAVHIARGCAIAERCGGLPIEVAASVRSAVEELTGGRTTIVEPVDIVDPDADDPGIDAYDYAEPVGLDPYHPDQPAVDARAGADAGAGVEL